MVFTKRVLAGCLGLGLVLGSAGCGSSEGEAPGDESAASHSGGTEGAAAAPKPTAPSPSKPSEGMPAVTADVVGITIGMSESEARAHLESEGWELKTHRTQIANIPGLEPLEYPDMLHFERRTPREGYEDFEVLGLHFLAPVPPEEARISILTFDRRSVPPGTPAESSVAGALTVTPEYATSMLALVKKKYGEPDALHEGACTSRGGTVVESIPIYEVHYFTNVRSYGDAALLVQISDTCRQHMSIRMEDGDWARGMRQRFTDFSKQQQERVSASSDREVDF